MSLVREVSRFPLQKRFGKSDNPAGERGNCVQTCLAALLDLPVSEIPHFYDTDESSDTQHANAQKWLAERGWVKLWVPWEWLKSSWLTLPTQALVMVSGKSPRGDWSHVVVGQIADVSWKLIHDPHPSQDGLDGEPYGFWVIAALPILQTPD